MTSTFFRICPRRNSHEQTEQHVGDNQHKPHVQSRDCQNVCHTGPRSTSSLRRGSNALFSPATNAETISLSASSMFTLCDTLYRCLMQHRNSPESTAVPFPSRRATIPSSTTYVRALIPRLRINFPYRLPVVSSGFKYPVTQKLVANGNPHRGIHPQLDPLIGRGPCTRSRIGPTERSDIRRCPLPSSLCDRRIVHTPKPSPNELRAASPPLLQQLLSPKYRT